MINIRHITTAISIGLLDLAAFSKEQNLAAKRETEKAGALHLLKQLLNNEPFELAYSATNKPFLQGRAEHISISHSHDKLAIICNRACNTGIDIELIRDKVTKIQHKFLNDREIAFANNDTEALITLWAAKETLYKVYGLKEMDFKLNLFIDNFTGEQMTGHIRTHNLDKTYTLINERIDEYKLVYVLDEV